jgi:hypothetical protein
VNTTGWLRGLEVTAGGAGIVSHAGVALLRALADRTGLTGGLSRALASDRLLVHDRGRVLADLACAIADGAEVISDFRVLGDQEGLFGEVASVPACWRALSEIAAGGQRAAARIDGAVHAARRVAWAAVEARHGALPGVAVADKTLAGVTGLRLDATVVPCHSIRRAPSRISKGSDCIHWAAGVTTPASRSPPCCAPGPLGPTLPLTTSRSWARRSPPCRRSTGGG